MSGGYCGKMKDLSDSQLLRVFAVRWTGSGKNFAGRGVTAWREQRTEVSQKAFTEIQSSFNPQRADFQRLYNSEFLWVSNVGGQ